MNLDPFSFPLQKSEENLILTVHLIGEVTADRERRTGSEKNCVTKSDFKTMSRGVVNQYLERQNSSMSRPLLDSIPLGTNMNNGKLSKFDSVLSTDTTSGFARAKWKSVRTWRLGSGPIIVRLIIKQI